MIAFVPTPVTVNRRSACRSGLASTRSTARRPKFRSGWAAETNASASGPNVSTVPPPEPSVTVQVKLAVPVAPRASVAEIVTEEVPAAVVVPEIRPVAVSTERPAGSPVAP